MGGAVYATLFAAFDPRAKALALIGGSFNDPVVLRERFGHEGYDGLMAEFAAIAQREYETGEVEYWPAANPDGMPAGMPGPEPWSYYGTERGARPSWENRCTALSVMTELTVTAVPALPMLTATPLLVVHGRGDRRPGRRRRAHGRRRGRARRAGAGGRRRPRRPLRPSRPGGRRCRRRHGVVPQAPG